MIAFVRSVIAAATRAGSMLAVTGSTSTKTGGRADVHDREDRRDVGVGDGDDLVARPDPERPQGEMQRGRAAADADAMGDLPVGGELRLERGQVRTHREARAGQARLEGGSQLVGDRGVPAGHILGGYDRGDARSLRSDWSWSPAPFAQVCDFVGRV